MISMRSMEKDRPGVKGQDISTIISAFLHYVIKTSVLEPAAPGSAGTSTRAFT